MTPFPFDRIDLASAAFYPHDGERCVRRVGGRRVQVRAPQVQGDIRVQREALGALSIVGPVKYSGGARSIYSACALRHTNLELLPGAFREQKAAPVKADDESCLKATFLCPLLGTLRHVDKAPTFHCLIITAPCCCCCLSFATVGHHLPRYQTGEHSARRARPRRADGLRPEQGLPAAREGELDALNPRKVVRLMVFALERAGLLVLRHHRVHGAGDCARRQSRTRYGNASAIAFVVFVVAVFLNCRLFRQAVDWWGVGVLTYELLTGASPFTVEGEKNNQQEISRSL